MAYNYWMLCAALAASGVCIVMWGLCTMQLRRICRDNEARYADNETVAAFMRHTNNTCMQLFVVQNAMLGLSEAEVMGLFDKPKTKEWASKLYRELVSGKTIH